MESNAQLDPWEHILTLLGYVNEEMKMISAEFIKEAKTTWKGGANQFEPRLLCYQTSDDARPAALKRRNVYLLPVKNGDYVLVRKSIYQPLSYATEIPCRSVPKRNDSLLLKLGQSEMSLIDNLRYAGVFERPEILGEPILFGPLLGGRHRTGTFTMCLGDMELNVESVQMEVDACFESEHTILLLEGKSSPKPIDSFNIRQLYYPYRTIKEKIGDRKQILCGFVHQLKSIVHIWLYTFETPERMDSIRECSHYSYQFNCE